MIVASPILLGGAAAAQMATGTQTAGAQTAVSPVAATDPVVDEAQNWVGRALILHGLYGGADLVFDANGHVQGNPPVVDWTLAGMNIEKVSRNEAGMVVLEGPRVATRYNPDQHQFERHAQKDERIRVSFPASDAAGVKATLAAVFGVGIDPVVERTAAPYWRHYFFPGTPWTGEDNVGPVIALPGVTVAPAGLVMPVVTKKADAEFTAEAQRDRVKGVVQVRVAVGLDGVPRQITIRQALGYGLDLKAAEAVSKYRFTPGTKDGIPVVVEMLVNVMF